MDNKLIVTAAPHITSVDSTQKIMQRVCIALVPTLIASVIIFGINSLILTAVTVAACVIFEYLYCKLVGREVAISDFSAVVTGMLLAFNLPATLPWWMAVVGAFIAIVIVKQLFGGPKAAAAIAKIMGGEASAVEKKAVVQCQGSSEHCKPAYDYKGIQTCAAAAALYGGPKTCSFACIGLGDCTKVCKFDAIHIVDGVAKVDKDKCTGCGACANICPKQVIMIDAAGPRKPVVMCSNKDKGAVANKLCTTSCIACGMCERTCKFDAIHVVDGVARIDYDKCKGCGMCAQKCPKHIILFPLKDDPNPPKPVVKPAAPAAAPAAKPEAKAEAKPETKAE